MRSFSSDASRYVWAWPFSLAYKADDYGESDKYSCEQSERRVPEGCDTSKDHHYPRNNHNSIFPAEACDEFAEAFQGSSTPAKLSPGGKLGYSDAGVY